MTDSGPREERLRPNSPASTHEIARVESVLGTLLPDELVRLYQAADGQYSIHGQWWVVWTLDQMAEAD